MNRVISAVLGLLLLGTFGTEGQANDALAMKQYGSGVHDYYDGRYFDAIEHFDMAMAYDNRDPRIYLFRGLAKRRIGDLGGARDDFLLGSQLEVALGRRDVGRALQRIQGGDRLMVERYRRQAGKLPKEMLADVIPPRPNAVVVQSTPRPSVPSKPETQIAENLPADDSDPFREEAPGLLGRGEVTSSASGSSAGQVAGATSGNAEVADPADMFDDAEPFGSGVVDDVTANDGDASDFVFGDEGPAGDAGQATDAATSGQPKSGVFGAALRALGRSVTPDIPVPNPIKQVQEGFDQGQAMGQDTQPDDPFADDFVDPSNGAGGADDGTSDAGGAADTSTDNDSSNDGFVDPFDF